MKRIGEINWIRVGRVALLIIADIAIVNFSALMALLLRFELSISLLTQSGFLDSIAATWFVSTLIAIATFALFRLYRSLWIYAGVDELIQIAKAVVAAALLQYCWLMITDNAVPRSFPFIYALLLFVLISAVRFSYRFLRRERIIFGHRREGEKRRTMLIGAGAAGVMALREFKYSEHSENRVVCIIDDDGDKKNKRLMNVPIVGGRDAILRAAEKYRVDDIVLPYRQCPTGKSAISWRYAAKQGAGSRLCRRCISLQTEMSA